MVRNALGLQQIPSNMTLNGIALIMSFFVMMPVMKKGYEEITLVGGPNPTVESVSYVFENGLDSYRDYLYKYSDPDIVRFFENAQTQRNEYYDMEEEERMSLLSLLPAYALSEIKSAFKIGFYLYLPFVVIDLLISSILLSLGMMMMSPITISVPIKLILFVVLVGWTLLSNGLIQQYLELAIG